LAKDDDDRTAGGGGAGGQPPRFVEADRNLTKEPASQTILSLSQALLAPLDAILKAQIHAARSFLNFLFQIGYPHQPQAAPTTEGGGGPAAGKTPGAPDGDQDGLPYQMDFYHDIPGGGRQKVSIPTIALVPVTPLGVSSADFQFDFYVRQIARHRQIQASEKDKTDEEAQATSGDPEGKVDRNTRPWFLVDTPLSIQGTFAPSPPIGAGNDTERVDEARFHVSVKVAAMPMPAALEKILAGLGQVATIEGVPPQPKPGASG
jgi:hypothetical protein